MYKTILLQAILYGMALNAHAQTLAFPTAEGYGKWVSGGRGGQVIHVTNLEDTDRRGGVIEGSLRAALKTPGSEPITIVFDTAGIINLSGEMRIQRSNVTIAGQSAPGDGICIKGGSVNLGGSENLIIRHVRFRLGVNDDGSFIGGACLNIENAGSFIVDHCSFSWSAEENIGVYNNQPYTIQWCISAEGLYNAGHDKGARSYGAVFGGAEATFHHNLLAHNYSRSPRFGTSDKNDLHVTLEYVNNVNYNWGRQNACYGGENEMGAGGSVSINFINNYYKPGPAYDGTKRTNFVRPSYEIGLQGTHYSQWYINGNKIEGSAHTGYDANNWLGVDISEYQENSPAAVTKDDLKSPQHTVPDPIDMESADDAYMSVIENVGAFPRDSMDLRIIEELKTGTATYSGTVNNGATHGIIDKPSDVGGYPTYRAYNIIADEDGDGMGDYWEVANNLATNDPEDRNQMTAEGYTVLEVYLNSLAGEYMEGFEYPDPEYTDKPPVLAIDGLAGTIEVALSGNLLQFSSKEKSIKKAEVYNLSGQRLIHQSMKGFHSLNLSGLSTGIYILVLSTDSGVSRYKFRY